jgi:hypothetical protein
MKRNSTNHVEDGSKFNAVFSNFPKIRQYLRQKGIGDAYDPSATFDKSWIEWSASQSRVLITASASLNAINDNP